MFSLSYNKSFAVKRIIDSLHRELFRNDDVAKKISVYLALSTQYETINSDSALIFWKEAQNLALHLRDEKPLADVYAQRASFNLTKNQLDQAFLNLTLAAKYYLSAGNKTQYTKMRALLGSMYQVQDKIAESMTAFIEVIGLAEELHLNKILPHALNNVGNIYMDANEFTEGLSYYTRSLKIFRESGDSVNIIIPMLNMGECYYYLNNPEVAVDYIRQALILARKYGDNIFEARGLMLMGMIRGKQKDYPGAIAYMNQSMDLQKSAGNYIGPAKIQYSELLVKLGDAWYRNEDMKQALRYQWEGYALAGSMKQLKQAMLSAQSLSLIHERMGKKDSALYYHKIYATLLDSLSRSGTVRTVKLLEVRQEYEKRQKEDEMKITLAKSAKRTQMISYIAIGVLLLAIILVLFMMLKLERQKKAKAELEKNSLHEKLEYKNNELTTNVMYLTKMNEMVMMVAKELRKMNLEEHHENSKIVKYITHELERVTNPDNWKGFENRFQQVHTDFYKKLGDKFPDLTHNELKLCAFLRLNMSTKEISAITFQSVNSIQVARFRLRQKLGIDKEENLAIFLSQF